MRYISGSRGARRASLGSARCGLVLFLGVGQPPVLIGHHQETAVDQLVHAPKLPGGILLDPDNWVPLQRLVVLFVVEGGLGVSLLLRGLRSPFAEAVYELVMVQ